MKLIFYDYEVFRRYWCVTFAIPQDEQTVFIEEDPAALISFYNAHKEDIWIGYNSRNYDQYITKGIVCGFDPWQVNDYIIVKGQKGWTFSDLFRYVPIINYDVMDKFTSLKQLEGFMGDNIKETPIDFRIERPLTTQEKVLVRQYNEHDVEETMKIFFERKNNFDAQLHLIKEFGLPMTDLNKTQASLVGKILGCHPVKYNDEWNISLVPTLRIRKYAPIVDWFKRPYNYKDNQKLNIRVAGINHTFGLGGLHGALEKFHTKGLLLHIDVESMYPSIMIKYGLLSRAVTKPKLFEEIYNTRLELKRAGKKKEQAPYKIILNSMFGISNASFYDSYDPRRAHEVCINGQLLLLDLIEHLEGSCRLIQSNTDGLIVQIQDTDEAFNKVDDICYEWEKRTGLKLSMDVIRELYQKDVNNYLWIDDDGKVEVKGAYVKESNILDNDLPIVARSIRDYMVKKIPVEQTISSCNDLIMFQKIVRVSSKYEAGYHGMQRLNDKTFRVFASKRLSDPYIGKRKAGKATIEKFANTPLHCFIDNESVIGKKVPSYLDKKYYVDLAKKRLEDYGIRGM